MRKHNVGQEKIFKLMGNSLYGRFGMSPRKYVTNLYHKSALWEIEEKYNVKDVKILNDMILVNHSEKIDEEKYMHYSGKSYEKSDNIHFKSTVHIASAITSYARIFMAKYIDKETLYTDTDSIFTTKIIDPSLIGKDPGQFKLEGNYSEAVFLAPKCYALLNYDNSEIIRIKGLHNPAISFEAFKKLLSKKTSHTFTVEQIHSSLKKLSLETKIFPKDYNFSYDRRLKVYSPSSQ